MPRALSQADRTRLLAVTVAGALAIFLLLQAAFVSWRLAALSFLPATVHAAPHKRSVKKQAHASVLKKPPATRSMTSRRRSFFA